MPANPWSQQTAPFRHSMQRFARPAGTLLIELDALEVWCSTLVDPALPAAAMLDSPFAGLHTPELPAPVHGAASAAGRAPRPGAEQSPRRDPSVPQAAPAAPSTHADSTLKSPTVAPDGAAAPGASPRPPALTQEYGVRPAFPVRGGRPASAPTAHTGRTPGAPHPAVTRPADQALPTLNASGPGPRLLRPEELLPRSPTAAGAATLTGDRDGTPPSSTAAAQPSASAQSAAVPSEPPAGAAAGMDLLAALTTALSVRPSVAARTAGVPEHAAAGQVPWRVRDGHSQQPPAAAPSTPGAPASGQSMPPAPSMPEPLAPSTVQPFESRAAWLSLGQPPAAALDSDLLADLVNEALLEQARRHGAHLP